jgi:2,4-dienoyl-CoA reductase-like NADH-dependent reductase (Old Yellow Enzyme family)/thioredoxin reductase
VIEERAAIEKLFSPLRIGSMELENRIVMPPMTTMLGGPDGEVTDRFIDFYAARARGGAALITAEAVDVHPYTHNLSLGDRGFTAIYDDRFIPGLRRFTDLMHAAGAKVSVQLHHSGSAMLMIDPSKPPVAPSAVPCPGGSVPRPLTVEEIEELVQAFGAGARRAREAGFDAVDIHGGHGYLIAQFMSAYFNRRTDGYGGDLASRLRFPIEVLKEVRKNVGEDFPIIFRFSADERVAGGRGLDESVAIAPLLAGAGADCLSITTGMHFTLLYTVAGMAMPMGLNVESAAAIKRAVEIPVMVAGRLNDPLLAGAVLAQGKADLIAIGRGLIADPELPAKLAAGRRDDIQWCIACNQGCIGALASGGDFACLVNPEAGRGRETRPEPASRSRRVWVVGGGPAGMAAARTAALRGHRVTLYERGEQLGGQLRLACAPPGKQEICSYLRFMERQLSQLEVEVVLGQAVDPAQASRVNPEVAIVATGSRPLIPDIPGIDADNVVTAHEILAGDAATGPRVVVAGGGRVGCETAEFLDRCGKDVVLVEMRSELAADVIPVPRESLLHALGRTRVEVRTSTQIVGITAEGVAVECDGRRDILPTVDTVVLALGVTPVDELADALREEIA